MSHGRGEKIGEINPCLSIWKSFGLERMMAARWKSLRGGWLVPARFWVSAGVSVGETVHEYPAGTM